ncbi:MAG: translation initiation factor IF-3 [Candidatus Zambryskibacteria bacterium CG10_big_fil_rev_8_21_14_0_10_42_12]|uniref:Translation initiation factor IF-3 n=1 Tax=Candidatus Zambryskibacteria bacterium CG10_big_fil_rev_8_21_14_0_10_42_12 TaxID=1975115 RepID=A0A2H0QWG4_9BACT|nr:MAG: translation initiation factor IF-3 [Candidatus Zambryskibacteria bacterium CG10_big_fil_rev_8_21_14_0_10_42_12]
MRVLFFHEISSIILPVIIHKQRNNLKDTDAVIANQRIKAPELRVIGPQGENFDVMKRDDALKKAIELGLDLIMISPGANPPVAKITDYGKFLYEQKKKARQTKAKAHTVEVKNVQIKPGTSDNDLSMKARKASEWLSEGHRVKIDLFLRGRIKYMDQSFLKERLERILKLVSVDYKVADDTKKSPKGLSLIIEKK